MPSAPIDPRIWRFLWRTTTARLTLMYGALFVVGIMALLGLVYLSSANFVAHQIDQIILGQTQALRQSTAEKLPERIAQAQAEDLRSTNYYGLFSADGVWITGNVRALPSDLPIDGAPRDLSLHTLERQHLVWGARALATRLPWGEVLFVGYDGKFLHGFRQILINSLLWSGAATILLGLTLGAILGLGPLQRIADVQLAARRAMDGDLSSRLPVSSRRDEIDMLAAIVNSMMTEVQRLLGEVENVGNNVAHDLRTPLTRLRAQLHRLDELQQSGPDGAVMLKQALHDTDILLQRFKALTRIAEIDRRKRRAGIGPVKLQSLATDLIDLYRPLTDDLGLSIKVAIEDTPDILADRDLLFEALTNLLGNAAKFTPPGGTISLTVSAQPKGPRLEISDDGPGVAPEERELLLQRFQRLRREDGPPGSGLGLSIVAAVARLHDYRLALSDAKPGLRVTLDCWPTGIGV